METACQSGSHLLKPTTSMKVLGAIAIAAGALTVPVNVICPANAMRHLAGNQGAEVAMVAVPIVGGTWLVLSLMLLLGGVGLVRGRLWGRALCIVFGFASIPLTLGGAIALRVIEVCMALRGGPAHPINFLVAVSFSGFSIVLLPLLMSGVNQRWAMLARGQAGAPPLDGGELRSSRLALASLILCICPPPVLSQLVAAVLGLVALAKIRRSDGKLEGRALAGTAVGVGAFVVLAGAACLVLVGLTVGMAKHSPGRSRSLPPCPGPLTEQPAAVPMVARKSVNPYERLMEQRVIDNLNRYARSQSAFHEVDWGKSGVARYATPFTLLKTQENAEGDKLGYIDDDFAAAVSKESAQNGYWYADLKTIGGAPIDWTKDFAIRASPANSGDPPRRTFIIATKGIIYCKGLGPDSKPVEDFPADPPKAGWELPQ